MSEDIQAKVRQLSGLRRALYHTAISRGMSPEKAYRVATREMHAADCENAEDSQ